MTNLAILILLSATRGGCTNAEEGRGREDLLSPTTAGRMLAFSGLKLGDLLLSRTDQFKSAVIRKFSGNGPFSHVAIVSEVAGTTANQIKVIEAVSPNVREITLTHMLAESSTVVVLRSPALSTGAQANSLTAFLISKLGSGYDNWGAFSAAELNISGKSWKLDVGNASTKFYCSELVVAGFDSLGIHLTRNHSTLNWSPNNLAALVWDGNVLDYVGHLKYKP